MQDALNFLKYDPLPLVLQKINLVKGINRLPLFNMPNFMHQYMVLCAAIDTLARKKNNVCLYRLVAWPKYSKVVRQTSIPAMHSFYESIG